MWTKITSKALVFGVLGSLFLSALVIGHPTTVSAQPFACEVGFYQMISGQLTELDPDTGEYVDIGAPGPTITTNALGYNIEDNYLYAIRNDVGFEGTLVRIHNDGTVENIGVPTGLPTDTSYIAGDFDAAGNLYIREIANSNEIWVIDVSAGTASVLTLSTTIFVSELVFIDGYLYGARGFGTFHQVDVSDGTVVTSSLSGLPGDMTNLEAFGAGWTTIDNELYLSRNASGVIYRIDDYTTINPVAVPVLQGSTAASNDGASCPNATSVINELAAADDSYTATQGETLTIPAETGMLNNDTGDTITVTDFTQPTHGSVTANSDGSFTYTPNDGFSGIDSFTYTITDAFGLTATATVSITVIADPSVAGDTDALAETGQTSTVTLFVGGALILVGVTLYYRKLV